MAAVTSAKRRKNMCVVSNVGDYYGRTIPQDYPDPQHPIVPIVPAGVSQQEFDALKKEVEKMKKLLKKAKGQCERRRNERAA